MVGCGVGGEGIGCGCKDDVSGSGWEVGGDSLGGVGMRDCLKWKCGGSIMCGGRGDCV